MEVYLEDLDTRNDGPTTYDRPLEMINFLWGNYEATILRVFEPGYRITLLSVLNIGFGRILFPRDLCLSSKSPSPLLHLHFSSTKSPHPLSLPPRVGIVISYSSHPSRRYLVFSKIVAHFANFLTELRSASSFTEAQMPSLASALSHHHLSVDLDRNQRYKATIRYSQIAGP